MVRKKSQSGLTVVELLVGLIAGSVVMYAAMSLYISQHKQIIVQEQIADMQSNIRAATEVIARAVRNAGYNILGGLSAIETHNSNPDTIVITYDSGKLVNVRLEQAMPQTSSDLNCQDHDLSALPENASVYIYDTLANVGEFFLASRTMTAPSRIRPANPLSRIYPAGSIIISMNRVRFFIDRSISEHANLMLQSFGSNPEVFAENIIDLNFRYFMADGSIVTQTSTPENIRMVEIDVVGRTDLSDDDFITDYRARNFTLRVKVRNLDL
ncbi:MAG: hypothetical protein JSU85_14115 [Candidatus Zixiibacteriota bacterium]|nr:MAG: hypothetical protein JSU85_14115 [candidate division Zixibacteria bacterium]